MQVSKISLVFVRGNCTVVRDMDTGQWALNASGNIQKRNTLPIGLYRFVQVCVNMYARHANRENMIINKSPLFGL